MAITRIRSLVSMGQSLGNGTNAGTPATTSQPSSNLSLFDRSARYDITKTTQTTLTAKALVGPMRAIAGGTSYPTNLNGEDIAIGACNQLAALLSGQSWTDTCVAIGGMGIANIKSGGTTNAYASALWEVGRIKALATTLALPFDVAAILLTHGEADYADTTYGEDVYNGICVPAQTDYAAWISGVLPLFASQQSTTPSAATFPYSAVRILQAEAVHVGSIYCYGPKYQYTYPSGNQHFSSATQTRLAGEQAGHAIHQRLVNSVDIGLKPLSYALSNANKTITITCNVFAGPIVIDGTVTANHQSVNTQWGPTGLEAIDDSGNLTIDIVTVDGTGTKLIVTLHATPTTGLKIGYALTPDTTDTFHGGLGQGGRYGQIRDSDTFAGAVSGTTQHNWLVHFQSPALT
jgi:hypothetical protein